jgi:hypothetical protein
VKSIWLISVLAAVLCGGCASSTTQLYRAVATDDAAVQATSSLLAAGTISKQSAKTVYTSAAALEGACHVADTAIQGGASAAAIASDVQSALDQALRVYDNLQALSAQVHNGLAKASPPLIAGSSDTLVSIANLTADLLPSVAQLLIEVFNANTVSESTLQASFKQLDTDLSTLASLINPPATQPSGGN